MEEKHEEVEDVESASSDSFIIDTDDDEPSTSGQDDGLHLEASLLMVPFYYDYCYLSSFL